MSNTDSDFAALDARNKQKRVERPSMASEMRAWVAVGAALLIQIIGGVWWAATLSAQNTQMQSTLTEMRQDMRGYATKADVDRRLDDQSRLLADHEARVRIIERSAVFRAQRQGEHGQ